MRLKKIFVRLLALLLFGAATAGAQTITTVTGTVVDPNGVPFAGGIVTVTLNGVAGQPSPIVTATGSPVIMPTVPTASGTGVFTTNLVANGSITPGGTTYNFRVCAPPVPPPLGSGNTCVTLSSVTIAGASQDLSSSFGAIPPPVLIASQGIATSRAATFSATAQGANLSAQTLLTVPANVPGTYRLACYVVISQAATTSSTLPACNAIYTDSDTSTVETIAMTTSPTTNTVGTVGSVAATALPSFQAKAGTNIQVSTTGYASAGATPMQYAIRAKLEFLGAP